MYFKIKQKLWENVPKEAAFKCPAAKLQVFVPFVCILCSWIWFI